MKRWAAGLAIVLVVLGGGLWWLYTSLDFVVKNTIERIGPDIVGAPVTVREVRISAADGRGTLRGIEIGNPPGYASRRAIRAGTITVGIEPASLRNEVVAIREIVVEAPEIVYEVRGATNNIEQIRKNIDAYVKRAGGEPERRGEGAPPVRAALRDRAHHAARRARDDDQPAPQGRRPHLRHPGRGPARRRQALRRCDGGAGRGHRHQCASRPDRAERAHQRRRLAPRWRRGALDALRGLVR